MKGIGWELYIKRFYEQKRKTKVRTIGHYQIFHNGVPTKLYGMTVESPGPGNNKVAGNQKCVEAGTYQLATQDGQRYKTYDYKISQDVNVYPHPGFELLNTGNRKEILVHPGAGFLKSVGCINLTSEMVTEDNDMEFASSRWRVIAMIEDMKKFLNKFPEKNGIPISGAYVVIEE